MERVPILKFITKSFGTDEDDFTTVESINHIEDPPLAICSPYQMAPIIQKEMDSSTEDIIKPIETDIKSIDKTDVINCQKTIMSNQPVLKIKKMYVKKSKCKKIQPLRRSPRLNTHLIQ